MLHALNRLTSWQLWLLFAASLLPASIIEIWYVVSGKLATPWYYGEYGQNTTRYSLTSFAITLIVCGLLTGISFTIKRHRWIVVIPIYFILSVFGLIIITHADIYHAPMSLGAVASLYETNTHEAIEFFKGISQHTFIILGTYALFLVSIVTLILRHPSKQNPINDFAIGTKTLALILLVYLTPTFIPFYEGPASNLIWRFIKISNASTALRIPISTKYYLEQKDLMEKNLLTRLKHSFETKYKGDGPEIAVFILGESLRRSNMSIYGYEKNTTPNLSKLSQEMRIFNKAISPAPLTIFSVPKLISLATVKNANLFYERPSIISIAKSGGYETHWLSNQGSFGGVDTPATYAAREADHKKFINTNGQSQSKDLDLLPFFKKIIENNDKRKFIVIHTMGSHQTHERRYPKSYAKFSWKDYQDRNLTKEEQHILSTYDNSVLYTDNFIHTIIKALKNTDKSAWMLFTSDHGLSLYDSKTHSHGHGRSVKMYDVPLFIWEHNWNKSSKLFNVADTHKDSEFVTENLFHSLLNMLDIYIPEYDSQKDILNGDYKSGQIVVETQDQTIVKYNNLEQ